MQNNGSDSQPPETNHQRHQHPPQKSWMPLQYRPPAMVMPHHMMTPQHYIAPPLPPPYMHYHYHYQPHHLPMQHSQPLQGSGGENKTIWVGDLQHWMDETYLHNCFGSFGEVRFFISSFFTYLYVYFTLRIYSLFVNFESVHL